MNLGARWCEYHGIYPSYTPNSVMPLTVPVHATDILADAHPSLQAPDVAKRRALDVSRVRCLCS